MHLLGPAFSTISTKTRKSKLSDSQHTKYAIDWKDDCKRCKRLGIAPKTLAEYVQYRQGKFKPKLRGTPMPEYNVDHSHREKYKSQDQVGVSFAKTPNQYTGTLIKGISTLHKSNAVPVISEQEMHDHANMRR
jgi:hypothetical protein